MRYFFSFRTCSSNCFLSKSFCLSWFWAEAVAVSAAITGLSVEWPLRMIPATATTVSDAASVTLNRCDIIQAPLGWSSIEDER